jgi:hypothetical protein
VVEDLLLLRHGEPQPCRDHLDHLGRVGDAGPGVPFHLPQRPGDVPRVEERRARVTGLGGHELELPVSDLGVGLGQCRFLREASDGGDEGLHVFVAAEDGDGGAAPGGAAVAAAEQRGDLSQGAV